MRKSSLNSGLFIAMYDCWRVYDTEYSISHMNRWLLTTV
jgi:hypothetical protein